MQLKEILITKLQEIEKKVGLENIDSEEKLIEMALVTLLNEFEINNKSSFDFVDFISALNYEMLFIKETIQLEKQQEEGVVL